MRVETAEKHCELTHSPNAFLNDISPKRIGHHKSGLIFNAFNLHVGKIISIMCAI